MAVAPSQARLDRRRRSHHRGEVLPRRNFSCCDDLGQPRLLHGSPGGAARERARSGSFAGRR
eukprot:4176569-Pyramimonas_sp.AAC.1